MRDKLKHVIKADNDTADNIANGPDLSAFDAFAGLEFTHLLSDAAQKSGAQFLVEIGVPKDDDMFMQVNTRAAAYAKAHAADLVTQIDDTTRDEIRELITNSLAEGMTYQEVSDKLEEMYSFSPERADLIARTESAIAGNQGILEGMRELKSQGVKIKKIWLPDAEACDACLELGNQDAIPLEDDFESDDYDDTDAPPLHPNCRCNMISEIEDEKDDDDES